MRPAYTYATADRGESAAREELGACRAAGLPATWEDDPSLPFLTRGAVRLDEQAQLDPMDLVEALVVELVAHGGVLVEHTRVLTVPRGGRRGPLDVDLGTTHVQADRVVLATGIPVLDRGGFFARLQPRRSYVAALTWWSALPGHVPLQRPVTRSIRSRRRRRRAAPGRRQRACDRSPPAAAGPAARRAAGRARVPRDRGRYRWSAQDPEPSELPFVGPMTPGEDRVLMATGFDKWGFTNAVAAAVVLSKEVLGGRPEWAEAYTAWSARELGALPLALAFNGEVALRLGSGWLRPLANRGGAEPREGQGEVHYEGAHPVATSTVDGRTRWSPPSARTCAAYWGGTTPS